MRRIASHGDDVSWDLELRSPSEMAPLAVTAHRSTASEPPSNLEAAAAFILRKVGMVIVGEFTREDAKGRTSVRYRVRPADSV